MKFLNKHDVLTMQHRQVWRRAALLALLCVGLALLVSSNKLHQALIQALAVVEGIIAARPLLGAALLIVFSAASAMLAFVSVAPIVPVIVYTWGPFFSVVLLWVGWIVGGLCAYSVGRYLGRPVVLWFTPNSDALARLESRVHRDTPLGIVFLIQLAMPSEIPGYLLGLVRYHPGRYVLSLGLAELPFAVATVLLGEGIVEQRAGVVLSIGAAIVALIVGTFYLLRSRLAKQ